MNLNNFWKRYAVIFIGLILTVLSIFAFLHYYTNGFGLAYNDARSHLDIGRRVVENLKPGFAQLGSVWLPLPHLFMLFTVWNDFMWHSGLSGAIQSMISYVAAGILIYYFLSKLNVGIFGRIAGVLIYALNLNILYLQSTAMTELLLLATMLAGVYELLKWHVSENIYNLVKSAFWIMLSTLIRYDGWFLFAFASFLVFLKMFRSGGYRKAEGLFILFGFLAGFGIILWFAWNLLIFKDFFYFVTGPYSAAAQQAQLEAAGNLPTKHNLEFSIITYLHAVIFNSSFVLVLFAVAGAILFFFNRKIPSSIKFAVSALFVPFMFNILALYMGHSVLFVENLNGSWFNVRYGLMMVPAVAIFCGYFLHKAAAFRWIFIGLFIIINFYSVINRDIVTLDDALIGSSGKNVKEVSGWLSENSAEKQGFVLISVASHDAIIFSSGMKMSRFIHEGTGDYWRLATENPTRWARWIIMRTHDRNDQTFKILEKNKELQHYKLIKKYPFADIYELKPELVKNLQTKPVIYTQRI